MAGITDERREYLRSYQLAWVQQRRNAWIAANGPCAECGSGEDLEVDHVNPGEKKIVPAKLWSLAPDNPVRIAELAKCQVLCRSCHAAKTARENTARFDGTRARHAALTPESLAAVREHLALGHRNADIARELNISPYVVSRVKRGEAYKNET